MKLYFKQKVFSWLDSYNVFDENNNKVYGIKGKLAVAHKFLVTDANDREIGQIIEKVITWLPVFIVYRGGQEVGSIKKKFSVLDDYDVCYKGWTVKGDISGWRYKIYGKDGKIIATLGKKLLNVKDVYEMDIVNPADALEVVMFAVAMDACKATRSKRNM